MAHSLSAKKRVRQNEKCRQRNRQRKLIIKDARKGFLAAVTAGDLEKASTELNVVVKRLDRTAARNTIHKNAASRTRSRMTLKLNALKKAKATGGTKAATA